MNIDILNVPDPACDAFVGQKTESKICHLPAWSNIITRVAGHRPFYLVARDGGEIRGVLPLTQVRSRLFGNRMISQAFSNYGGPLTDSPEIREALFNYAVELATKLNCESIEFRNIQPLPYNLKARTEKISMYLPLVSTPDEIWKALMPKVRNQVRKAEKSNLTTVNGGIELLDEFYRVYTIRMHQLGTPCYSRKFMYNILQTFPKNSRIFTVCLKELTVGAGFTIYFNKFVEIPWAATLVKYNNLCPNNLLYWSVIKHYCLASATYFDFGRCTIGGSTYQFKKQWGSQPVELHYQYWVRPGHQLSILSPTSSKYQKKVQMWRKLPLWMTRLLGPYISRNLP
jgi:FemAB-related protein (PEP-CTERM system-associated)